MATTTSTPQTASYPARIGDVSRNDMAPVIVVGDVITTSAGRHVMQTAQECEWQRGLAIIFCDHIITLERDGLVIWQQVEA